MKNYLKLSILCITSAALLGSVSAEALKIATVDITTVFDGYYRKNVEEKVIHEERARISLDSEKRMNEMRDFEEKLAKLRKKIEDPTISDSIRKDTQKEFQMKIDELKAMNQEHQEFVQRQSKAIQLQMQSSIGSIRQEISEAVVAYAKNEAFDYVFDKSGVSQNQVPFLVYSKGATDITAAILAELNKNAPKQEGAKSE